MDQLEEAIGIWGDETFTQSTRYSVLCHLRKEMKEFWDSIDEDCFCDPVEAADIVILLMHYARKAGFNLTEEIEKKFAIIQQREWGEPDADGVVEHKR